MQCKFWTILPVAFVSAMASLSSAKAATIEQDIQAVQGEWEGETAGGTKMSLRIVSGQGDLVATGEWKVEGGALGGDAVDFTILRRDSLLFLVPSKNVFEVSEGAYTMDRLPSGGLRFVRLVHVAGNDPTGLAAETFQLGKLTNAGTRTVKVARSAQLCADAASPSGKSCAAGAVEEIALHKVTK